MGEPKEKVNTNREGEDKVRKEIDAYLKDIYYNPRHEASFTRPDQLFNFVKREGKYKLTRAEVADWLKWQRVYTTHLEGKKAKHNSPVVVPYLNYQYDIDSAVLPSTHKKALKYFILAIDIFSRKVAAKGVKDLKAPTSQSALKEIFSKLGTPERIRTDQGGEYVNKAVKNLTEKMGIIHFIAYPPNKANYAERAIKTIKKLLYKQMQTKGKNLWTEQMLQDTVAGYNARPHSATGLPPSEIDDQDVPSLWFKQQERMMDKTPPPVPFVFEINDPVRLEIMKESFAKDYKKSFSEQIYYISERYAPYNVQRYRVKTYLNQPVQGSYLANELRKVHVDNDTQYAIEKILSRRIKGGVRQVKVRWEGYNSDFDSWINASEIDSIKQTAGTDKPSGKVTEAHKLPADTV